jgi:hypothetical protein
MVGAGNRTLRKAAFFRMLIYVTAGFLLSIPIARACSWSYLIWGIRSESADPLFRFVQNGKAGYINSSGIVVIRPTIPDGGNFFGEFHEGLLAVGEEHGFRYVNQSGETVLRTDAWSAFEFSEGLAQAGRYAGFPADKFPKWGFIDRSGHFVIAPEYFQVESFSEGLARVAVNSEVGSTGYIDHSGKFVIPPRLTYGSSFHEGRAAAIIGGPCRITNGGSCARPEFQTTQQQADYNCRYSFIDKAGEAVSDVRFDDAGDFSEGLAPIRIGRQWGYADRTGQISIPPRFQSAEQFSEGLAAVTEGNRVGFIDHLGVFVIPPRFENAESFSDGLALVSRMIRPGVWTYSFIDRKGNEAFPGEFSAATSFSHGLAHVRLNEAGGFAWINTSGVKIFTYVSR